PGFFNTLGVEPAIGRSFHPDDGGPGRERVAIVTAEFFRRHFGEDPDRRSTPTFDGTTLRFADGVYDIIGVLPSRFEWFGATPEVWIALGPLDLETPRTRRDTFAVGRLRDGISETAARSAIEGIALQLEEEYPEANRGWGIHWVNLRHDVPSPQNRQLIGLIQAALILVMLIACVDVASLYLVRGRARAKELAVRAALGASRGRLARQMAIESGLISTLAAGLGLGLGWLGLNILRRHLTGRLPLFHQPFIDLNVIGACVVLAVLASLVFGVAPVLQARRLQAADILRQGGNGTVGTERWAIPALVVAQIGLSMALLGGAGLLVRSFLDYQEQDPGFTTDHLVVFSVTLPDATYPLPADQVRATDALTRLLDDAPGLAGSAIGSLWPRAASVPRTTVHPPEDRTDGPTQPRASRLAVSASFFATVGLTVERGDLVAFSTASQDGEPVTVINRSLADRFWPSEDPIGQPLDIAGTLHRIVAVVSDVRHAIVATEGLLETAYVPWVQDPRPVIRGTLRLGTPPGAEPGMVDPRLAVAAARKAVNTVDPRLVVADLQTLDAVVEDVFFSTRLFAGVLSGFGLLALLLAGLGTYGVLAYAISLRTSEIGIRMALGESRSQTLQRVLGHGLRLGVIGIAVGLPLVWLAHRLVVGVMSTHAAVRPTTIALAAVVLLFATLVAALRPALRAARIEPADALRRT
ncbi:MAG: FtsX-like permease family protein, partial [Acidobacteriota bacterium]